MSQKPVYPAHVSQKNIADSMGLADPIAGPSPTPGSRPERPAPVKPSRPPVGRPPNSPFKDLPPVSVPPNWRPPTTPPWFNSSGDPGPDWRDYVAQWIAIARALLESRQHIPLTIPWRKGEIDERETARRALMTIEGDLLRMAGSPARDFVLAEIYTLLAGLELQLCLAFMVGGELDAADDLLRAAQGSVAATTAAVDKLTKKRLWERLRSAMGRSVVKRFEVDRERVQMLVKALADLSGILNVTDADTSARAESEAAIVSRVDEVVEWVRSELGRLETPPPAGQCIRILSLMYGAQIGIAGQMQPPALVHSYLLAIEAAVNLVLAASLAADGDRDGAVARCTAAATLLDSVPRLSVPGGPLTSKTSFSRELFARVPTAQSVNRLMDRVKASIAELNARFRLW